MKEIKKVLQQMMYSYVVMQKCAQNKFETRVDVNHHTENLPTKRSWKQHSVLEHAIL
jgi:hypothetical protein